MGKVTRYSRCFSTHILTRRMTNLSMDLLKRMYIFNSHPHKEDDDTHKRAISCREFFNSHPHKEDDGAGNGLPFTIMFSTHILTRRMTLASSRLTTLFAFFNSHPHKEDDGRRNNRFGEKIFFNSHPHKEDDQTGGQI